MSTTQVMSPHQYYEILPDGRWHFRIDNYRLQSFGQCEQLFDYTQVQNYRTKRIGQALSIGAWWSCFLEHFYRELSFNVLPTIEQTMKIVADSWVECKMEEGFKIQRAKDYVKFGGPHGAMRMAAEYYDKFSQLDFKNWRVVATEAGFGLRDEILLGQTSLVVVHYVGKPDLWILEIASGKSMPVDHKTIDYVKSDTIKKYKPQPQFIGYVYAGKVLAQKLGITASLCDRAIVNVASRFPPAEKPKDGIKKPRFVRVYPNYTDAEIEEWRVGILHKCERIRHAIEVGVFDRHESNCHIYGGCAFRGVCSLPPNARHIALGSDFVKVEPWTPYTPEEDNENDV